MKYKHFYIHLAVRLLIIIVLSILGTYLFLEKKTILLVIVVIILSYTCYNLISYFNRVNRWISFFLMGIENEDTSLKIPENTGNKTIDAVFRGMNNLNKLFQQTKIKISTQEQYFNIIISHSATGLFSVNEQGRVINVNIAAQKLIDLHTYQHVNSLSKIDKSLPELIMQNQFNSSEQSAIYENKYGQKILFKLSRIIIEKEKIILVAISDITKELDNRDVDAWVKLARTLSHEIMNNITPITTLSQVISGYFIEDEKTKKVSDLDNKTIQNTVKGLNVIEETSRGLLNFVSNYRKFTKLPEPHLKEINLSELIENNLIASTAFNGFETIELIKSIPNNIYFNTDADLLSQVIINIIKNALEAMVQNHTQRPQISVSLSKNNYSVRIDIQNNGPEILPEVIEQIFVPFYTTKEDGSGIGLSLSKQIILAMGGDIFLSTGTNNTVIFTIILD